MEPETSKTLLAVRLLAFFALAGFMFYGPLNRQVLDGRSYLFRNWVMFSGFGRNICDVEFRQVAADGSQIPLNRTEVLGYESYLHAPRHVRRLKTLEEARRQGRQICQKLPAGDRDVRLVARCGSRKGWVDADDGSENLCPLSGPRPTGAER